MRMSAAGTIIHEYLDIDATDERYNLIPETEAQQLESYLHLSLLTILIHLFLQRLSLDI